MFLVEEYAFDATKLADWAERELRECGIEIRLKTRATAISRAQDTALQVTLERDGQSAERLASRYVFNCTYSGLNQFGAIFRAPAPA